MAAAASIIGTVVSAAGAIYSANAQAAQAKYQAAVADRNAKISEENASREGDRQQIELRRSGEELRSFVGEQLAAQGGQGVSIDSPTARLVRRNTSRIANEELLDIATAGQNQIRALLQQGADLRSDANAHRSNAKSLRTAGFLNAASTIIGGFRPRARKASSIRGPVTIPTRRFLPAV